MLKHFSFTGFYRNKSIHSLYKLHLRNPLIVTGIRNMISLLTVIIIIMSTPVLDHYKIHHGIIICQSITKPNIYSTGLYTVPQSQGEIFDEFLTITCWFLFDINTRRLGRELLLAWQLSDYLSNSSSHSSGFDWSI